MLGVLFILITLKIWGCIDINKTDNENLLCILSIDKKSDITPRFIENCSKLASLDKFMGYLCLCRLNRVNLKTDLALSSCSKAKTKNPFSPYPHLEFAQIYKSKNKLDLALTEVDFALNIDSHNFHANLLAAQLYEEKNLNKSLKLYLTALDILKNSNQPYVIGKKTFIEDKIEEIKKRIEKAKREEEEKNYLRCIKNYKDEKDPDKALQIIESCLAMRKEHSPTVYLDYIKALYNAGMYQTLLESKYLKLIPQKNLDELNLILADAYYKTGNFANAAKHYKKIIDEKSNDLDILSRYAEALEKSNDKITALEIYQRINTIKPSPKIEEKIEDLKISLLTDNEILEDLKVRGFVEKERTVLLPPHKKLYLTIKLAEKNGAIKYLMERYPGYANIVWENPADSKDLRMTYTGYNLYMRYVSQRFIKTIEKTAQDPRDIFKVRDKNGFDIFDKDGKLTYEGLKSYYEYEKTKKKNWYFPNETLPQINPHSSYQVEEKMNEFLKEKKRLERLGYEEIAETEYLWLIRATNCPEDVLLSPPCSIKKLDSGNGLRYFLCMKEGLCNQIQLILATYIASYRSGNTDIADTPSFSNFFGRPAATKRRFCEDGKIWDGK